MYNTKRTVLLALFVAIAGVLHAVETWIPVPLPIPGAKFGLANIASLLVVALYGWRDALNVAILRVLLGSLLSGVFLGPTFAMSMSGAVVSVFVMGFVYRHWHPMFSLVGVSVIGAVAHNLAQILAASLIVASASLLWYLPYLTVFAVITGLITGLTATYFVPKISNKV